MEGWSSPDGKVGRRDFLRLVGLATLAAATEVGLPLKALAQAQVLEFNTLFHSGDAQAMERIVKLFNEQHKNVQISLTQGQWAEYYAQLFASVAAGNPPHIGICHTSRILDVYRALTPLEESRAGNLLAIAGIRGENYVKSVWDAGVYRERRYLVPLDTHMWGLWYNKDLFRQAGLDPEKPPETREEFERAADAIKTKTGKFAFHPAEDALPRKIRRAWEILFWGQGGELLTPDGRRAAFNDERGLQALDYLVSMIHKRGWNQPGTDGFKQFAAGQLGMLLAGNWYFPTAKASGVNFGFHYVPKFFQKPVTWGDSHNLVIPRQPARVPDEMLVLAIKTIKWINEHSDLWGIYGGHIPAYLPAQRSKALQESDTSKIALRKFADMARRGWLHYPLIHEKAPRVHAAIEPFIQEAYNGRLSPKEALSRAEVEVNRVLAS